MSEGIVIALITGGLAFLGNVITNVIMNRRSTALMEYRIDKLEDKVDKHNNIIERTYHLEQEEAVIKSRLESLEKDRDK